jgi:RNA polymerase sigma-54 factor
LSEHFTPSSSGTSDDPLYFVAAPRNFTEGLLIDLRASLPEHDYAIATFLVESLDERGLLAETPEQIAATLKIDLGRVFVVLRQLQEIGPPGIAAHDVRECLLAQLGALAAQGMSMPYAYEIVRDHLDDMGAHRYTAIARKFGISTDDVKAVRAFVQQHCWPYPTSAGHSGAAHMQHSRYRQPDVAIVKQARSFAVEVLQSSRRALRLNPLYEDLARQARHLDSADRSHVQDYIARARTFLNNLQRRESTLRRISEVIVDYQHEFLQHGVRHLVPLTRAEVAAHVGVHESTVSRATADKTVLLPDGSLLPFADFFTAARPVQDVLRELIASETNPLSDAALADLLKEQGHSIARRTVAKYREQMQILPSTLR